MIRNLKALGLAFAAMLALGAVAASAASAQQGHLDLRDADKNTVSEATLIATENAAGLNALTAFGGIVECPDSKYTGHEVDTTDPHEPVPDGATEITLTPHYNQAECEEATQGFSATVTMNSCDYDLEVGQTTGGENTYALTAEITCDTPGDEIHVSLYNNEHHESGRVCTIEVGEQYTTGAHITDNTDSTLTAEGTLGGIHVERHGLCVLDGKGTTTNNGEFHLDADVTAEDDEENAVTVGITD